MRSPAAEERALEPLAARPAGAPPTDFLVVNRHREDVIGGSEIQCDLLARQLGALGHRVAYAVMEARRGVYASAYPCVPVPRPGALALWRVLRRTRPEVVYWRFNKRGLLAAVLAARLAGCTFVFAFSHDDDGRAWPQPPPVPGGSPARRALRVAGATWRRLRDAVDWLGHAWVDGHVAQHAGQRLPLGGRARRVVRSSVLAETVPFRWERPFVVWVANLKPRKRPEIFLELARALSDEPVDFLAVGAVQNEAYRPWEERRGFPPNFRYLGARAPAEVNGIIAAARFLVLTCEPEGFPNVLLQAWNQGRPTLALAYDPEGMIAGGGLGAVAASFDELVTRARAWIRDPDAAARLGEACRAHVAAHFSTEANARAVAEFSAERRAARRGGSRAPGDAPADERREPRELERE